MGPAKFVMTVLFVAMAAGCAAPRDIPTTENRASAPEPVRASNLGLETAAWGYLVIDAETGDEIAARNPDTPFPPASTVKIATMIAALDILGPDHRFRTLIAAKGRLQTGVLTGDIILQGTGDPLLSSGDLRALAIRLRDLGIRSVDGRFLYTSTLPEFEHIDPDQPATAPYNQGISGLNIDFNRAIISGGGRLTTPNEAHGLIGEGRFDGDRPVRQPSRLTALMLHRFALAEGVQLPSPEPGAPPDGAAVVAEVVSLPLIEIVRAGLEYSNNLVAEAVGLAAARARGVDPASLSDSALAIGLWLEQEVPDLARFAQNVRNHSGLSTKSRVTPRQIVQLLRYADRRRYAGWRFDSLLPPGGGREGYNGRFRAPESAFRVWAKTGSMHYIKGIAGYLDATDGRRLIFAHYVFDSDLRAELDRNLDRSATSTIHDALDWRRRTEIFEAQAITRWISSK